MSLKKATVDVAPDTFSGELSGAFQLRDSWYFVTKEGDIFRSPSFLGQPSDTGVSVGRQTDLFESGPDFALLTNRAGRIWSFNGEKATLLSPPGSVSQLWHARDGAPMARICDGWYAVNADGSFIRARRPSFPKGDVDSGDPLVMIKLRERIERALVVQRRKSSLALAALSDLVALADGSFARRSDVFPPEEKLHCQFLQAGTETLRYCAAPERSGSPFGDEDAPASVVYRVTSQRRAEAWVSIKSVDAPTAGPGPALIAHERGGDVWIHAGRRDPVALSDHLRGCQSDGPSMDGLVLGLAGSWVLTWKACGKKETYTVIDLSASDTLGDILAVSLTKFVPAGSRILDAALSAEGDALAVLLRDGREQAILALGSPGTKLPIHSLPPETMAVGFVNARRGVAVGKHLGQVWTTIDGAVHWASLVIPMKGDAAAVPVQEPPYCDSFACWLTSTAVWVNPGALKQTGYEPLLLIAPQSVPKDRFYDGPRRQRSQLVMQPSVKEEKNDCPAAQPSERKYDGTRRQ